MNMFVKCDELLKQAQDMSEDKQFDSIVIYLDNEGRQKTKFTKSNYLVLAMCLCNGDSIVKKINVTEKQLFGKNAQKDFDNETFIKVQIFTKVDQYNEHDYHKQFVYKVTDQEILKLNLLQKLKELKQKKLDKEFEW